MNARADSPPLVGLLLVAAFALACGARPVSPRAPAVPNASGEGRAGGEAQGATSTSVAVSAPPPASSSAAPDAAAVMAPLVARPAKVAFVAELLAHAEPRALASAPDGGLFVVGDTTFGYSYTDDLFLARLTPAGEEVFFTQGTGRNVRDLRTKGDAVFFSTELVGQVRFAGATIPTVGGSTDLFIAKTDLGGKLAWGKMIGTPDYDRGAHLAPSADGGVFVSARSLLLAHPRGVVVLEGNRATLLER